LPQWRHSPNQRKVIVSRNHFISLWQIFCQLGTRNKGSSHGAKTVGSNVG
jgi:hypothetical protein